MRTSDLYGKRHKTVLYYNAQAWALEVEIQVYDQQKLIKPANSFQRSTEYTQYFFC